MPRRDLLAELRDEIEPIQAEGGGNPRIHPNGFIQLDLEPVPEDWHASHHIGHSGASRRLHIWNPPGVLLPRQETYNEVHDHVFDMWSTIARGALWQVLYELRGLVPHGPGAHGPHDPMPGQYPTHERYRAVYEKTSDSRLEATGEVGVLVETERFRTISGNSYRQQAFTLHDSEPAIGLCVVTIMIKEKVYPGEASVICPLDQPPDNSFDRTKAASPEFLWDAIGKSLRTP